MTLEEHFQIYREAVLAGSLEGFQQYASTTPTKNPQAYPTIYDYIKAVNQEILRAINTSDHEGYWSYLHRHQHAMVQLFSAMVEELLWGYESIQVGSLLWLIEEYGWKWFKFSAASLSVKLKSGQVFSLIPRYDQKWSHHYPVCLDADEMSLLTSQEGDKALCKALALKDSESNPVKIVAVGDAFISTSGIDYYNDQNHIKDWTLPIRRIL